MATPESSSEPRLVQGSPRSRVLLAQFLIFSIHIYSYTYIIRVLNLKYVYTPLIVLLYHSWLIEALYRPINSKAKLYDFQWFYPTLFASMKSRWSSFMPDGWLCLPQLQAYCRKSIFFVVLMHGLNLWGEWERKFITYKEFLVRKLELFAVVQRNYLCLLGIYSCFFTS